jgi:hypothetical protein
LPLQRRRPGTNGRPQEKGARLPLLKTLVISPQTTWQRARVSQWYSQGERELRIVSGTALWESGGQPPLPIRWVPIRDPERKFDRQALFGTDLGADPVQIISWFVLRWQMETTFQAVRTHLGLETQRQWSDQAIARTAPALMAHPYLLHRQHPVRRASWYAKTRPTFVDAIACVRLHIWHSQDVVMSSPHPDRNELIPVLPEHLLGALCYAT